MRLQTIRERYINQLSGHFSKTEIDSILKKLIKYYFDWDSIIFLIQPNKMISKKNEAILNESLNQLIKNKPVQYIIGSTFFYKYIFQVDPSVLIPRPETEELVSWLLEIESKDNYSKIVLDIGTGSGCIPITLKLEQKSWKVNSIDICNDAIKIAKKNAKRLNADVNFFCRDINLIEDWSESLDIIISNPPYITYKEKTNIKKNVLDYEPSSAIFVPNHNPLGFYKKIINFSINNLKSGGLLYLEINPIFVNELKGLFSKVFFDKLEVKKDFFGRYRMLKIQKR